MDLELSIFSAPGASPERLTETLLLLGVVVKSPSSPEGSQDLDRTCLFEVSVILGLFFPSSSPAETRAGGSPEPLTEPLLPLLGVVVKQSDLDRLCFFELSVICDVFWTTSSPRQASAGGSPEPPTEPLLPLLGVVVIEKCAPHDLLIEVSVSCGIALPSSPFRQARAGG